MSKPTKHQHTKRIEFCLTLIRRGFYDGEIKRLAAAEFDVSPRTVERYLRRARDQIYRQRGRSRRELQAGAMAIYEGVIRDRHASPRDRIAAQKRIDELLGLEEPRRLEHSGPDGGPIETAINTAREVLKDPDLAKQASDLALAAAEKGEFDGGSDES